MPSNPIGHEGAVADAPPVPKALCRFHSYSPSIPCGHCLTEIRDLARQLVEKRAEYDKDLHISASDYALEVNPLIDEMAKRLT